MGREIRRVPPTWEHPRDEQGHYRPLYDRSYREASERWLENCMAWEAGTHPGWEKHYLDCPYFWDYDGPPPDREYYRCEEDWTEEEATACQVYETVSEGTPKSPVFETLEKLVQWLISQGHSEQAARAFAESGWAPSMAIIPEQGLVMGIDAVLLLARKE